MTAARRSTTDSAEFQLSSSEGSGPRRSIWSIAPDPDDSWDDALCVDDDELIVVDEDVTPEPISVTPSAPRAELPRFELPPPRLPPMRPSMRSLAPLPPPAPVPPITVLAPPTDDAMPRRIGRPNMAWGVLLLVAGAAIGFGSALAIEPEHNAPSLMSLVTKNPQPPASRVGAAPVTAGKVGAPEALKFETPLDITVPRAAPKPVAAAPAAPAATAARTPGKAAPAPAAEPKPEPRVDPKSEPAARIMAKAAEAPKYPSGRNDLPPAAVDALVREQLRSSLR